MRLLASLLLLSVLAGCSVSARCDDALVCNGDCVFEPNDDHFDCTDQDIASHELPACTTVWQGSYTCAQGLTALKLSLSHDRSSGELTALFHFDEHVKNPGWPSGCFTMTGAHDAESGRFVLQQEAWIDRPLLYLMVDLDGAYDPQTGSLTGAVFGPGCTTFELTHAR